MLLRKWLFVSGLVLAVGALSPLDSADANIESALRIDVPVKLEKAKVVLPS